jgi:2-C-methyl-D-erythritol 4-phosphate cytidylyltransferase/2-C-methyl-D-erythritol 2,4-cyclodiphosphate synthase
MTVGAVILAAGQSERYGRNKLLESLAGRPLWRASFDAFASHARIDQVGIVCSQALLEECQAVPGAAFVVLGGSSRQQSSRIGIEAFDTDIVLIHDAARPFVSPNVISRVLDGVLEAGAAVPVIPVTDTIKRASEAGLETLDRASLMAAQTPQGALRELWLQGFAQADGDATDDVALLERQGIAVLPVAGDPANVKITRPGDLPSLMEYRTGHGYDIHAFSTDPERPMWLGGLEFDDRPGLDGHSDADAVLHAVVDALMGGAGLGDIGEHFPNSDPRWKNRDSGHFLRHAAALIAENGWNITHIDVSILAERPKITPVRAQMQARIAELAGIDASRVSVKATTNEGLGAIGRGEGIAAFAVASLVRASP